MSHSMDGDVDLGMSSGWSVYRGQDPPAGSGHPSAFDAGFLPPDPRYYVRRPVAAAESFSSRKHNDYIDNDAQIRRRRPNEKNMNDNENEDNEQTKFGFADYMIRTTGFQGPGKMWEAPHKLLKLLWLLAFLAAFAVMVIQLVQLFEEFFSYPVKTQVKLGFSPLALPALTVCNVNPIRLSLAANLSCKIQNVLKLPDSYKSLECLAQNESVDYYDFSDFGCYGCEEDREELDEYYERRQQIAYLLAEEGRELRVTVGHQIEDMVIDCTLLGRTCSYQNVTPFLSKDYGNCYTFNAPNVKATKSGPEASLDVTFNLEPEEFVSTFKTGYGLRVVLHDNGTRAFPSTEGFTISSGTETNIGIRLTKFKRIGGVYGNCDEGTDVASLSGYKYTITNCRDQCLQRRLLSRCQCVIPDDASVEDIELLNGSSTGTSVRYCFSEQDHNCASLVYEEYDNITDQGGDACTCNNPCNEAVYYSTISSRAWPVLSYVRTLEAQVCSWKPESPKCDYINQSYTVENIDFRRASFARLRLYYERLNFETVEEAPFYDMERFLSDIGGTLGLWIGVTVLGLMELFEFFILLTARCCRNVRS